VPIKKENTISFVTRCKNASRVRAKVNAGAYTTTSECRECAACPLPLLLVLLRVESLRA
jgi:hypothetical protein